MGELSAVGVAAKEGANAMQRVKDLEKEVKTLTKENKTLSDNFNSERVGAPNHKVLFIRTSTCVHFLFFVINVCNHGLVSRLCVIMV